MGSFAAIAWTRDQSIYSEVFCPPGAFKAALLADYVPTEGIAPYMNDEDIKVFKDTFTKNGFAGPLCYYKAEVRGLNKGDEAGKI